MGYERIVYWVNLVYTSVMLTMYTDLLELLRDVRAYTKAGGKVELVDQPEQLILAWGAKDCTCTQCVNRTNPDPRVCESPSWGIKLVRVKDFTLGAKIPEGIAMTIYDALRTTEGRLRLATDHLIEVPAPHMESPSTSKTLELTVVSTEKT
jgi:hypothetical protein